MTPSPRSVLLIDQSIAHQMLLREIVRSCGHVITVSESGQEALDIIANGACAPDIIFLDCNLGDMAASQVLHIYQLGVTRPAPVFVIAEDVSGNLAAQLLEGGAKDIIKKPLRASEIEGVLATTFAARLDESRVGLHSISGSGGSPPGTHSPDLRLVAPRYIDHDVLMETASFSSRPEFMSELVLGAISDIERTSAEVVAAIDGMKLEPAKQQAHALRSVALQVGATHLARCATTVLHLEDFAQDVVWRRLRTELISVCAESVVALRDALDARHQRTRSKPA